jgi:hypothetical protein
MLWVWLLLRNNPAVRCLVLPAVLAMVASGAPALLLLLLLLLLLDALAPAAAGSCCSWL